MWFDPAHAGLITKRLVQACPVVRVESRLEKITDDWSAALGPAGGLCKDGWDHPRSRLWTPIS